MKNFKTRMITGFALLALSLVFTTPVMAASAISKNIMQINEDVMLPAKPTNSPATFLVPNYVDEKILMVGGYPYQPGETWKQNTIVMKRPVDGNVFKLSIDAKQFPNVHSVEVAGNRAFYYKEFNEYDPGRMETWGKKVFSSNGAKKEVVLSLDFLDLQSQYANEMLYFHLVFLDKNGNELYYIADFNLLILNETGSDTIFNAPPKDIAIEINGKIISSSVSPILVGGSTFVPIRVVSENLGAKVNYDEKTKEITLVKNDRVIKIKIASKKAFTNGVASSLTAAPRLEKGITFVPIRMIAEAFDSQVKWEEKEQKVIISNSVEAVPANKKEIESAYASKIKAIQQLPNTHVVANHIADLNNDNIDDLLVSIVNANSKTINSMIYTYKDGEIVLLDNELKSDAGGKRNGYSLLVVSSKDGDQSLLKYMHHSNHGGVEHLDVIFYKLDANNKLQKYLVRDYFSDMGDQGKIGDIDKYYNSSGEQITKTHYNTLLQKYINGTKLYFAGNRDNDGPVIYAVADKYNSPSEEKIQTKNGIFIMYED